LEYHDHIYYVPILIILYGFVVPWKNGRHIYSCRGKKQ
jgi:hypothetical protein